MSRLTAVLLFLESLRRLAKMAIAEEEYREIYARIFIIHPDGGAICSLSTESWPMPIDPSLPRGI